jgi:transposase
MIAIPSNVRVWLAAGHTDMRRGMNGLALQVQEGLQRDPHVGDLFVFRGKRGDLVKIIWHDGLGLSLYAKRLDRGRFVCNRPIDPAFCILCGFRTLIAGMSAGGEYLEIRTTGR